MYIYINIKIYIRHLTPLIAKLGCTEPLVETSKRSMPIHVRMATLWVCPLHGNFHRVVRVMSVTPHMLTLWNPT